MYTKHISLKTKTIPATGPIEKQLQELRSVYEDFSKAFIAAHKNLNELGVEPALGVRTLEQAAGYLYRLAAVLHKLSVEPSKQYQYADRAKDLNRLSVLTIQTAVALQEIIKRYITDQPEQRHTLLNTAVEKLLFSNITMVCSEIDDILDHN
jgi:hypothetical protein